VWEIRLRIFKNGVKTVLAASYSGNPLLDFTVHLPVARLII
jgi:hypothetical protein